MKLIHASDIHFDHKNPEPALKSLYYLAEVAEDENVDAIIIAGDLFDKAAKNTEAGGFPELLSVVTELLETAPVFAVVGTPTHDVRGCYEVFTSINAPYVFHLLEPREDGEHIVDNVLIMGCPEPSKTWFLADKRIGQAEANEAIKSGMREILLGCGAVRREHNGIPCVFVYHGNVEGASLDNGQTLPQGEITIGRDDLALVGADYYALGHIHKAQKINGIPAYYAGSAYPKTWGEEGQKGFNLITFSGDKPNIEFIAFPHAPRRKIVIPAIGGFDTLDYGDLTGYQVWLEVRGTKAELKIADISGYEDEMFNLGAIAGSRVTTTVIPTETVRAGHIGKAERLRDKVKIYAENSTDNGKKVAASVLSKADELEARYQRETGSAAGARIRIDSLRLRGAIGIMKGQGVEEVELDFSSLDDGLVALVGRNGAGKTTLLENMHPYTTLLTREGKLQDHFCLRDSYRDLRFTDERTGNQYRALISIDGKNASGKVEYYLYRNGEPITDGRKDSYNEAVEKLFGPIDLYLRSAFVAQKERKPLASATQGERKELFAELAGIDHLQVYSLAARELAKECETAIETDRGRAQTLEGVVASRGGLEDRCREIIETMNDEMLAAQEQELFVEKHLKDLEAVQADIEANRATKARIADRSEKHMELCREADAQTVKIENARHAIEAEPEARKALETIAQLTTEKGKLQDERHAHAEARARIDAQYQNDLRAYSTRRDEASVVVEKIKDEGREKKSIKDRLLVQVDTLTERIAQPIDDTCLLCRQTLPAAMRDELLTVRANDERKLADLQQQVCDIDVDLNVLRKALTAAQANLEAIAKPDAPTHAPFDDARLKEIESELAFADEEGAREIIAAAERAKMTITEAESRLEAIQPQLDAIETELGSLEEQLLPATDSHLRTARERLEDAERKLKTHELVYERAETTASELVKQIEGIDEKARELNRIRVEISEAEEAAAEWRYLEKACGLNGIQALELDALAPSIAEVANRLLEAAYGSRFVIEFRTTRIGGKGSQTKQIEDFQIIVHDSQGGTEQELDTLSGGETVWIRKAIYDAFGLIRAENTGLAFLTAFQDEADGALDPDAREAYFRMLTEAHERSGRRHTVVITHSSEAQEMIAQKIDVTALAVEPVTA